MTTLNINSNILLSNAPECLIERCIADNTFANPAYVSNEQAGRSNWNTDRTITTYRYDGDILVLPRGYMRDLLDARKELGIAIEMIDERSSCPCKYPPQLYEVTLRPYQERAVKAAIRYEQGTIIAPTGSGKTIIGLELIKQRRERALILLHRGELAKQWKQVIYERLGIQAGLIGNGKWSLGKEITIAMVQTLAARREDAESLCGSYGLILVDEGHHTPASTFFDVIGRSSARYRYTLSATPSRRDGLEQLIYLGVGPMLEKITKDEVEEIGATVPATVFAINTGFRPREAESWNDYIVELSANGERNELIIELACEAKGAALILVDRIEHAIQLAEMFKRRGIDHILAHGQLGKEDRGSLMKQISETKITIGTSGLLGEGIDVSTWGTLIMGSPISSEAKLMQAIGRVVRLAKGKTQALVYDLMDDCGFSGSSFKKRFDVYKKHKIWVEFPRKDQDGSGTSRRDALQTRKTI